MISRRNRKIILTIVVLLVVYLARGLILDLVAPVWRFNHRTNAKNTLQEYPILFNQALLDENAELKELLGRQPSQPSTLLVAVLASPGVSPYDTLIIDVGSNLSVRTGSRVYYNNIVLGEVVKLRHDIATVELYSSAGVSTQALIATSSEPIMLVGQGGGVFKAEVPGGLKIDGNALLVLPGLNLQPLAVVASIKQQDGKPLDILLARTPVNIYGLKWVEVEK